MATYSGVIDAPKRIFVTKRRRTLSKTELEALCTEVLELKGVTDVGFFGRDGTLRCWKTKVEPRIISKAEVEGIALTRTQMIHELVSEFCKYVGPLELMAFHHKHRNVFVIPLNEIFLVCLTEKVAQDPLIKKVRKIVKA